MAASTLTIQTCRQLKHDLRDPISGMFALQQTSNRNGQPPTHTIPKKFSLLNEFCILLSHH